MNKLILILALASITLTACSGKPLIPICGETGANCSKGPYVDSYTRRAVMEMHDAARTYNRSAK